MIDKPLDEMNVFELRVQIAREVGLNRNYRSGFGKRDLNSIYAFLTGEFYFDKRLYNTAASPPLSELRQTVAAEIGIDRDDSRKFRRDELQQIATELLTRPDRRQ